MGWRYEPKAGGTLRTGCQGTRSTKVQRTCGRTEPPFWRPMRNACRNQASPTHKPEISRRVSQYRPKFGLPLRRPDRFLLASSNTVARDVPAELSSAASGSNPSKEPTNSGVLIDEVLTELMILYTPGPHIPGKCPSPSPGASLGVHFQIALSPNPVVY